MATLALSHRQPRWVSRNVYWGLTLLVGLLLWVPPFWLGRAGSLLTLGAWLLAAAGWTVWSLGPDRFRVFPLGLPLIAWFLTTGLSVLWSRDPALSLNPFSQQLAVLLVFLTAVVCARHPRRVRPALAALALAAAVLALYGVYQHAAGLLDTYRELFPGGAPPGPGDEALASRLSSGRAFALFTYPNLFAGFLAMLLPVAVALLLTARRPAGSVVWSAVALVMAAGLWASGSLGGWIAGAAGLVVLLLLSVRPGGDPARTSPWTAWTVLGAAVAGGVLLIGLRGPHELAHELGARAVNAWSALRMGWTNGLTGVGPGLFGTVFPDFQERGGTFFQLAHSFVLQRLAETGWAGLAALLWLLAGALALGWSGLRREVRAGRRPLLAFGLAGAAVAGVLHAAVDLDFEFLKTATVFWFLLGTWVGLAWIRSAPVMSPPRRAGFWVRSGLVLAGLLVLWRGGRSLPVEGLLLWSAAGLLAVFLAGQLRELRSWVTWGQDIPLRWSLGLFFVWGTLASLVSLHPEAAVSGLALGAAALVFYLAAVKTSGAALLLLPALVLSSAAFGAVAVAEALLHPGIRAAAGWPNPNLLAAFLALGLAVNTGTWASGLTGSWRKLVVGFTLGFQFFGLLATGSLSGLANALTALAVAGGWAWTRRRSSFRSLALLAAGAVAVFWLLPSSTGQRLAGWRNLSGPVYERLQIARAAIHMAWHRPVTGYGPGNFSQGFERFSFPNVRGLARFGKTAQFAHNEILQVAAVMGIPGVLLLGWIVWSAGAALRRFWRARPPDAATPENWEFAGRLGAWAALAGGAVQGLLDFNWHAPALLIWYLMLLGIALCGPWDWNALWMARRVDSDTGWFVRADRGLSRVALVVALFLAGAAALAGIRPLVSRYLVDLGIAQRYKNNVKTASRDFEQALFVHPFSANAYDQLGQVRSDYYASIGLEHWYQLAEWAFQKALALDGLDAYIHRHLGRLYGFRAARLEGEERLHQYDLAERQYILATEKAPHQAFLYFELGNLLREAGRLDAAERAWQEAVALEPRYAAAWSNLGVAQDLRGERVEAERSLRTALQVQSLAASAETKYEIELLTVNAALVHFNLAQLLEQQGRWEEAVAEYAEVVTLEPENQAARLRLERLQKKLP